LCSFYQEGGERKHEQSRLVNEVAKVVATKKAARMPVDTVSEHRAQKKRVVTLVGFGTFKVGKGKPGQAGTPRQV
jgi:nucleoid DNA-binding protein